MELGAGEGELFEWVRFGRFLPDGRVVVADGRGLFLRIYEPDGALAVQTGRPGDGPGEFRAIHGLWVTRTGRSEPGMGGPEGSRSST
jgi:hypothetical protein